MIIVPWGKRAYQKRQLAQFISSDLLRDAVSYLSRKATLGYRRFEISPELHEDMTYPVLHPIDEDTRIQHRIIEINKHIENAAAQKLYERFAKVAYERIPALLAPSLTDFEAHKRIIALQLAARERIHVYIVSDEPLVTELLRFAVAMHDSSVMIDAKGDKTVFSGKDESVFARTSEGIVAVTGIEALKSSDKRSLTEVLDSGMYVADPIKASKKHTNCRLLASSHVTIVGRQPDILRKQIPIDENILDEIHIVALVRDAKKPKDRSFSINKPDYEFIKGYYSYVEQVGVAVPAEMEQRIYSYVELLKTEEHMSVLITSNRIVGMIRLAKARARLSLRREIREEDIKEAYTLVRDALRL